MANTKETANKTVEEKEEVVTEETSEPNRRNRRKTAAPKDYSDDLIKDITASIDEVKSGKVVDVKNTKANTEPPKPDEDIKCVSITSGKLTYRSPVSNSKYVWSDLGASQYITFSEIQTMNNIKPSYLNKPRIIVTDSRVRDYFNLVDTYEKVAKTNRLEDLIRIGDLQKITESLDDIIKVGMKDVVVTKVRNLRNNKTLNNIDVITLLEDKLNIDLE